MLALDGHDVAHVNDGTEDRRYFNVREEGALYMCRAAAASKEREGEHVVDDHPGRQQPIPDLGAPGRSHHPVDQLRWEHPGQDAKRDVVGQSLVRLRLDPPGTWHDLKNNTGVVLSKRYWG